MRMMKVILMGLTWMGLLSASLSYGAETGTLLVGAGKADITPPDSILPYEQHGMLGAAGPSLVAVHDKLFARAIVLSDGVGTAAVIALDLSHVPKVEDLTGKIAAAAGLAPADAAGAWALLNAQSRRLGEEVVRVADGIKKTTSTARIWGAINNLTCPGQKAIGKPGDAEYKTEERGPVEVHLGLLMINDVALAAVGGELNTSIGQRLKRDGSFNKTIVVTQAGGSAGYIIEDSAYQHGFNHGVAGTALKPGCAEKGLPDVLTGLMQRYIAEAP
jgi:hypothetical protein